MTFPGCPAVYYGDEVGLSGDNDPGCRMAMEWDEQRQDQELLAWYKMLIQIRSQSPSLRYGQYRTAFYDDIANVFAFYRIHESEMSLIVLNAGENPILSHWGRGSGRRESRSRTRTVQLNFTGSDDRTRRLFRWDISKESEGAEMKKQSLTKMLALFLLAAMMLAAFTACSNEKAPDTSSSPQTSPADETTPEEPVTINFWHHYSAQSAENETLMNVLIPKFEEENPGYKVNAVSHEWGDLHDKILISAQSNTLPDVARLDIAWVPEFQKMGILVPLDAEMSDFDEVTADLLPSAMAQALLKAITTP